MFAKRLEAIWYADDPLGLVLLPASWVYRGIASVRRAAFVSGLFASRGLPVPVIVVGNIVAGGTGKTPLVLWLVDYLRKHGKKPGILVRGYKGKASHWPQQIRADSDPIAVGDEAVLLARRSGCPVVAGPDRVAAAEALLEHKDCDILISDDGLQHLKLKRDVEIAVVDGVRRHGNGHFLPAGPLREPVGRLDSVDLIVANGPAMRGEFPMSLVPGPAHSLRDSSVCRDLESFQGEQIHAVAGIGNPSRFFEDLRRAGLKVQAHPFPDHHDFDATDIHFEDDAAVFMTEKDAVKCQRFAQDRHWFVPVEADVHPQLGERLSTLLGINAHG